MEKELTLIEEKLQLCFFYEEFDLDEGEIARYQKSLIRVLKAMNWYLTEKLELSYPVNLNLSLVTTEKIHELNNQYRQKDKATDVLSFPLQENIRSQEYDQLSPELELGDLFICHSICQSQAQQFDLSYFDEFIHLLVHGFLHLLGHDHELNIEEEKLMESLEEKLIEKIASV